MPARNSSCSCFSTPTAIDRNPKRACNRYDGLTHRPRTGVVLDARDEARSIPMPSIGRDASRSSAIRPVPKPSTNTLMPRSRSLAQSIDARAGGGDDAFADVHVDLADRDIRGAGAGGEPVRQILQLEHASPQVHGDARRAAGATDQLGQIRARALDEPIRRCRCRAASVQRCAGTAPAPFRRTRDAPSE